MAEDVHVAERGLWRPPNISCWIDPVAFGKLAVQTAAGHGLLLFNRSVNLVSVLIWSAALTSNPNRIRLIKTTGASTIIKSVQVESDIAAS